MSGPSTTQTPKPTTSSGSTTTTTDQTPPPTASKPSTQLEEDDEFEDFPVEDWADSETTASASAPPHLWEESWDDNDASEDFAQMLREELKKMEGGKR